MPAPVRISGDREAILKLEAKLYEQHCAECHKADGKGAPSAYPPLAATRALTVQPAVNPIRIVLNGGYPRPFGMPPFVPALNDAEIAAVVSHVRTSWSKGRVGVPGGSGQAARRTDRLTAHQDDVTGVTPVAAVKRCAVAGRHGPT